MITYYVVNSPSSEDRDRVSINTRRHYFVLYIMRTLTHNEIYPVVGWLFALTTLQTEHEKMEPKENIGELIYFPCLVSIL